MWTPWSTVIARWPLPSSWPGLVSPRLDRPRHRIGIEAGIAAEAIRRVEVDDDQVHRTIGLGLEDEASLELQRRADQRSQNHRLAEEAGDRRRIVVAIEDGVDCRPEPDGAAAAIERLEREGNGDVVAAFRAIEAKVLQVRFGRHRKNPISWGADSRQRPLSMTSAEVAR